MSAGIGWLLAALGVAAGYVAYGWPGVVLALSVVVFWLLLQFSRALRVMRLAAGRPVGRVDSAVMLHSKLHAGLRLVDLLKLTRSLGTRLSDPADTAHEGYAWRDDAGDLVEVEFVQGRTSVWRLHRAGDTGARP
ncbi:MAG: hypothetical protein H7Z19_05595 [Chitinophagaceae bacterium]|nr:hypothetical protein [Rubrivivax sp.]